MPLIVFIPCILCVIALVRGGTRHAFLTVVLPVMLLLPTNFFLLLTHVPPLSFLHTTLFAFGIGMLLQDMGRWKLARMDFWMLLFVFSSAYGEYRVWGVNGFLEQLFLSFLEAFVPYMAGKLLIEQQTIRRETIERLASLIAIASIVGSLEYFAKKNPYTYFWSHFFPGQWGGFTTQVRWHFGRMAGPYTQSEFAGMVLMTGLVLCLWLRAIDTAEAQNRPGPVVPQLTVSRVTYILVVGLFMTQARGPWLASVGALSIAWVGRSKKPLRRAFIVATLLLVVFPPLYNFGKDYISGPRVDYGSEQETAQYRAELVTNYVPLAAVGGAWGWGRSFPIIAGQSSIDNEFLYVWVIQGSVGLLTLSIIFFESMLSLLRRAVRTKGFYERYLTITLLGLIIGLVVCLTTVYMGAQSYELVFLLVGWTQGLRRSTRVEETEPGSASAPQLYGQESFTVYT